MVSDTNIERPERGDTIALTPDLTDHSPGKEAAFKQTNTLQSLRSKKRRGRQWRPIFFSRLARVIFLSNLLGLIVLVAGSMAMDRFSKGLIEAKIDSLLTQATLITTIMGDNATGDGLSAELDIEQARQILKRVPLPGRWRVRLHDTTGLLVADSARFDRDIAITSLEPITPASQAQNWREAWLVRWDQFENETLHNLPWRVQRRERLRQNLKNDVRKALLGETISGEQYNQDDDLIVSVVLPIKRVQRVVGVVSLESADVDRIVNAERQALAPIIGLAFLVALMSSLILTLYIVMPMRRLSRAAEKVTESSQHRDAIPDLSRRRDEIGGLSLVMRQMSQGLYDRVDDIANFAAEVAHEIKNPLTSLRSASDTLRVAKTQKQREQLIDIVQSDVARMDRLISDISKASTIDANLARDTAQILDVSTLLSNLALFYDQTKKDGGPPVIFTPRIADPDAPYRIRAFELSFAQVIRNLIDNALTFSPKDGAVRLVVSGTEDAANSHVIITVEDDGPGIPPDNLETIFERFYTERPEGAQFGSHSGLGLAICRQIITAHRGEIWAENRIDSISQPGEDSPILGARFVVRIPRYKDDDETGHSRRRLRANNRLKIG